MVYLIMGSFVTGVTMIVTARDSILGITLLVASILMFAKNRYIENEQLLRSNWTDAISGRVICFWILSGFFFSMVNFYGYDSTANVNNDGLSWCQNLINSWEILNCDYPNGLNFCFVFKTLAITFNILAITFAVFDYKKAVEKNVNVYYR